MIYKPTKEKMKGISRGIKSWAKDDRPREKLLRDGEHKLSNAELLAIILRTGVKGKSALDLARLILSKFKTFRNMSHTDVRDWKELKGLGIAKITQIKSAIEIGRRMAEEHHEKRIKIRSSNDIAKLMMPRMRDLKKEVFKVCMLNSQNYMLEINEITQGTVNKAAPIIREIFQSALQYFAVSIVCVHNHPSGNSQPSKEDEIFTEELVKAGKVLQIKVLDHIIIGDDNSYSFADNNLL